VHAPVTVRVSVISGYFSGMPADYVFMLAFNAICINVSLLYYHLHHHTLSTSNSLVTVESQSCVTCEILESVWPVQKPDVRSYLLNSPST